MQRWKVELSIFLAFFMTPLASNAEVLAPTTSVPPAASLVPAASGETAEQEVAIAPVQQHLIDMMQSDFAFEDQKRSLANELVLEKLRSEIQKLKDTDETSGPREIIPPVPEQVSNQPELHASVTDVVELPKVLLISNIGGALRVAVSINDTVKLVKLNEIFTFSGHKFKVFNAGNNMPSVKEISK